VVTERRCEQCGQVIPWGQTECPLCTESSTFFWSLRRETLLLFTLLVMIILFVVTGFAAKYYHAQHRFLGEQWYGRGLMELRAGHPDIAIADFRDALVYSRDNPRYRLQLAQALAAAGRLEEARNHLLNLWEHEPGDGIVNLELARLAERQGMVPEAVRYFHDAIYGEWDRDPIEHRRQARLELCKFLLDSGQQVQAQSELIALAGDLPPDPQLQTQVATLLLRANEYDHALALFQEALGGQPQLVAALAGIGEIYFAKADYRPATRYLERALHEDPRNTRVSELLKTAEQVLSVDPYEHLIGSREKARRAIRAFHQALSRLEDCAGARGISLTQEAEPTPLQQLDLRAREAQRKIRENLLARDPDRVPAVMDLAFDMERLAEQECGPAQGLDGALLLLARTQGGGRP
jgi:tetratricopeptide (TPR) repeat protein